MRSSRSDHDSPSTLNFRGLLSHPYWQRGDAVAATQGALGLNALNVLARYKAKTDASLEVAAVVIDRSTYDLYTKLAGSSKIPDLKGKRIAIPAVGTLAHIATIDAPR